MALPLTYNVQSDVHCVIESGSDVSLLEDTCKSDRFGKSGPGNPSGRVLI